MVYNIGDGFLSIFKSRGVVLKAQELKEYDKIIIIYTEKLGKVSAVAKSARKSSSRFLSTTLPFCFCDYVLYRGKNLYTVNESIVIDSFQEILGDLRSITYASYLCELVDMCIPQEESNRDFFKFFVSALYLLKNNAVDIEILSRAFEIKILQTSGYGLNLDNFRDGIYISNSVYNILKYLNKVDIEGIYKLNVSENDKKELYKIMTYLIEDNFGKRPKSLDMLNYL